MKQSKFSFKLILNILLLAALLAATACTGAVPVTPEPAVQSPDSTAVPGPANAGPAKPVGRNEPTPKAAIPTAEPPAAAAGSDGQAVLLFGIGMHIEPLGAVPSALVGGASSPRPQPPTGGNQRQPDYNQLPMFQRHVQDIQTVAGIVESHTGRMTVQAQTPFTQVAIDNNNTVLADLAKQGHEIALHFHEDAHMGKNGENLPFETWCAVMQEEIALVQQASGGSDIRYWSGGNLYPGIFDAAACAGLDVNSDWKNPNTQSTPSELIGLHPWRPAGGTDGNDLSQITQNDPQGAVVFLPEGLYERNDFASMRRAEEAGGDEAYFEFLKQSLLASLAAAEPDQVNVFHFTIHPGEFRGEPDQPFQVIERFLSEVVDPLVASGQVRWATFSEMADAYSAWEQTGAAPAPQAAAANPVSAQPTAASPGTNAQDGSISFVVNVHDWTHPSESADILLKLVDLYEQYGVRGDFYFTAPVVDAYVNQRPDVIERLKNSDMTISYHIRPPHPLYIGFDQRLQGLNDEELYQMLLDYETYGLDLATGDLDRSRPGGYAYVAQVFGRKPVVASAPSSNPRLKSISQRVYTSLGAQVTVLYHEKGADIANPLVYVQDLLVRPSDFSVTRTTSVNGGDNFWWNYMSASDAARYDPTQMLIAGLEQWQQQGNGRAPFITSLIHENNFYRSGPEGWSSIYFSMGRNQKNEPLSPPFNLSAPDPSRLRSASDQAAIWEAYEALVAYAASHLQVITSQDLVQLAKGG